MLGTSPVLSTLLMSSSMDSKTICVSEKRKTTGCALMPASRSTSLSASRHSDMPKPLVISIWEIL